MANIKTVTISGHIYSLKDFSKTYNLPYSTVRKYYKLGYRNIQLLKIVDSKKQMPVTIDGTTFKNRHQASKLLGIPISTLYTKLGKYDYRNQEVRYS
ncbi:helix-turn-helix domain-containing protein [uncultured Lactobacillus sp.]|uniref:helix-turn-helix domain-containing protein n=1 Tax=uncultured Lactobacillus sp. TaxID=153152 RepID=UPI00260E7FF2|nr:helix-turn-helix domain-containing protein [uncultured Lactobacillus sp.]